MGAVLLTYPALLLWALPAIAIVVFAGRASSPRLAPARARALLAVRVLAILLVVVAFAGPTAERASEAHTLIVVLDDSSSLGPHGVRRALAHANERLRSLAPQPRLGLVLAGEQPRIVRAPSRDPGALTLPPSHAPGQANASDLDAALEVARALFPAAGLKTVLLVSDGLETVGSLDAAADGLRRSAVRLDVLAARGPVRPDARIVRLQPGLDLVHRGAPVTLTAELAATQAGRATIEFAADDVVIDTRPVVFDGAGFARASLDHLPDTRAGLVRYSARLVGFEGDAVPENDHAHAIVEVAGTLRVLLVEGQAGDGAWLASALGPHGMQVTTTHALPGGSDALAGYGVVVLADVPATRVPAGDVARLRSHVERDGGGLVVIGGPRAYGLGGYHESALESLLPVKAQPTDDDKRATALVLVLDRSGSMRGPKIEICKSAAVATAALLKDKDFIGIVSFDNRATWVVPMMPAGDREDLAARVAVLAPGGGTNIHPAMSAAYKALAATPARLKHMIVLTDGRSRGGGYVALARRAAAADITVSTVGVGEGADNVLLAGIAIAGGGRHYTTRDPADIPRIFTRDAAEHLGRILRERPVAVQVASADPMLRGWDAASAPRLLGYVRTSPRRAAQVALATPSGDPLLAQWRLGAGKVTAFMSDAAARWAAPWIASGDTYARFWSQVLRGTARTRALRRPPTPPTAESPTGDVMRARLQQAADLGGGRLLDANEAPRPGPQASVGLVDLTPLVLALFLAVFAVDVLLRRAESAAALWAWGRAVVRRPR